MPLTDRTVAELWQKIKTHLLTSRIKTITSASARGKKPLIILGIVVIVMVIVALVWWFLTRNEETTDDAFTDGDVVTIAPKTAGYVTELRVRDNQRVKKGMCWW